MGTAPFEGSVPYPLWFTNVFSTPPASHPGHFFSFLLPALPLKDFELGSAAYVFFKKQNAFGVRQTWEQVQPLLLTNVGT